MPVIAEELRDMYTNSGRRLIDIVTVESPRHDRTQSRCYCVPSAHIPTVSDVFGTGLCGQLCLHSAFLPFLDLKHDVRCRASCEFACNCTTAILAQYSATASVIDACVTSAVAGVAADEDAAVERGDCCKEDASDAPPISADGAESEAAETGGCTELFAAECDSARLPVKAACECCARWSVVAVVADCR